MALFGFGKDRKEGGTSEQVLAYLEDAQRVRCPFLLVDGRKVEHGATLVGIDEGAGTATFQLGGPFLVEKGARLDLLFLFEGLRLGASVKLVDLRAGTAVLSLPATLELRERRRKPRARLNPKEGATLTGLSSLFEGIGITGLIENLSEAGLRVKVERAMNIKDEARLSLGSALVKPGHAFMLLKLNKLPRCSAVVETAGKVAYVESSAAGLFLGISLEGALPAAAKSLVSSRAGSAPSSVPVRSRRRPVVEEAPARAFERSVRPDPKPDAPSGPPAEVVPDLPVAEAPEEAPQEPSPEETAESALLRLKKRSRAVVVFPAHPGHGELIRGFLLERGYARIMIASSPEHLRTCLQQPNVGLLLLDGDLPVAENIALLEGFQEELHGLPPVVLAAEDLSRAVALAAIHAGASQLLVKPYALDEELGQMLDQVFAQG